METVLLLDKFFVPGSLVPILIFFARIIDVSMGTLRIIMVGRGLRTISSLLGFMEVFIWLIAISQVLQNLHGIIHYVAYSAGFASGTFVGMTIERRLTFGLYLVRIIVPLNENGAKKIYPGVGELIESTLISGKSAGRLSFCIVYVFLLGGVTSFKKNNLLSGIKSGFVRLKNFSGFDFTTLFKFIFDVLNEYCNSGIILPEIVLRLFLNLRATDSPSAKGLIGLKINVRLFSAKIIFTLCVPLLLPVTVRQLSKPKLLKASPNLIIIFVLVELSIDPGTGKRYHRSACHR